MDLQGSNCYRVELLLDLLSFVLFFLLFIFFFVVFMYDSIMGFDEIVIGPFGKTRFIQ